MKRSCGLHFRRRCSRASVKRGFSVGPGKSALHRSAATSMILFAFMAVPGLAFAGDQLAPSAVIPPPNSAAVSNNQPRPVQEYDYTPRINQPEPSAPVVPDKPGIVEQ